MGSRRSTDKNDLGEPLSSLPADDLRFLCWMFRLTRGGSKQDLVERLLDSEYSADEIAHPATELLFGLFVEPFVPKSYWAYILERNELASSGSRHDLRLLLIENGLFDAKGTLEALSLSQLREVHFRILGRVPTAGREATISEILSSFGFGKQESDLGGPEPRKPKRAVGFDYDVALSFAGEDRSVARQIASGLEARGVRFFMDEFERTLLWGKDLSDGLRSRYGERTRYVVILVSKHYAVKDWTDFEFTVAKKEAGRRTREFILPVRLDDTPLPGLRSAIAYLSLTEYGVDGIVEEIVRKLRIPD